MDFNWRSPILPRIALLVLSVFLFGVFAQQGKIINALVLLGISAFQVKLLIDFLDRSNQNLTTFLDSVKFDDFSFSAKGDVQDRAVLQLEQKLNEAMKKLRSARREKDSESLFF